jgi:hypothetical protein
MSIILDESENSPRRGKQTLKSLRAWLAQRERDRRAEATREIVRGLYPRSIRAPRDDPPRDPTLP